jgi:hypothetical protein
MNNGPHRPAAGSIEVNPRDPEETLNYRDLLRVCGTATNAFINVARSSGLPARRLLLMDHWGLKVSHVVAEVQVDGKWIVVDPAFRTIMRDSSGQLLSRDELRNPATLAIAHERHPRLRSDVVPLRSHRAHPLGQNPADREICCGRMASYWPTWSDSLFWTMLVERESFGFMILSFVIFVSLLFFRVALRWYAEKRLGLRTSRMRTHLARIGVAWLEGQRYPNSELSGPSGASPSVWYGSSSQAAGHFQATIVSRYTGC